MHKTVILIQFKATISSIIVAFFYPKLVRIRPIFRVIVTLSLL